VTATEATGAQLPLQPAPPTEGSGVLRAVRRHPLGAFLAWFATVGQALAFTPVVIDGLPTEPFLIASTVAGLLLPAVVVTRIADGAAGPRDLRAQVLRVRVPARWYAFAVLGVPAATVAVTAVLAGPPTQLTASSIGAALTGGLVLQLVAVLLTVNLWEEVAWTGFVQARLRRGHGPVATAALTGVLFALGHVSLVAGGPPVEVAVLMALLVAVSIPFRFLQGWVHERSGSLLVVGLVHAAGNAAAVGSLLGAGLLPRLYGEDGQSGLAFALLGLVVLAATVGRRRR
jgi:membrane protease YdiL (CAAX protease family)